jgi:hypothetical protein
VLPRTIPFDPRANSSSYSKPFFKAVTVGVVIVACSSSPKLGFRF